VLTRLLVSGLVGIGMSSAQTERPAVSSKGFVLEEATVRTVHAALAAREITCVQLVQAFLDRIDAYDRKGPSLRAIIAINPRALDTAAEMDRQRASGSALPPLHCIPVILKDNFDTADMATTGGSVTLAGSIPPEDGFVVKRLRDTGAVILAKANLTELARTGTTVSSLGGQTRNPYDLTRTPGGSSGGTGAAIAANFGVLGTGSDTGQSIRSPASALSLVGLRPTRGLVSRRGVMPLSVTQDEAGPITRTVEDAARMLDVMAGYDPADPITAFGFGRAPKTYTAFLDKDGQKGARIGVLTDFFGRDAIHQDVNAIVESAITTMSGLGATIVRISIPDLEGLTHDLSLMSLEFKASFNRYLAGLGARAPVKTLDELVARGEYHPSLRALFEADASIVDGPSSPEHQRQVRRRGELRQAVMTVMAANRLDAILYPHQRRLVVPIGDDQVDRNGVLSNGTGFPAIAFPGGFSKPTESAPLGVPVGIELLGAEWSEPVLFRLAYAFEQAARVRKPPSSTPSLR
jgi:Asp-tRNA(Asn)/Glu-tRNA(Gln) amidotransferase A subunit family amidase